MKHTLPGSRLAVLALLVSAAALSYSLGIDAARQSCQTRPTAQLIR